MKQKTAEGQSSAFLIWLFGAIALVGLVIAAINAPVLGWPAFLLIVGMAAIGAIACFALITRPLNEAPIGLLDDRPNAAIIQSFDQSGEASLITRNKKPVYSNQAYRDLAQKLGVAAVADLPPAIDRLFGASAPGASAVIFKLYHVRKENESAEEIIETKNAAGEFCRFRIHVTGLQNAQFWRVTQESVDGEYSLGALASAPVGLFSVLPDGTVLAMNGVLKRWIGGQDSRQPEKMAAFIENPDSLLGSVKTPGRIVRNDTRLITKKGIVTPAVMTGSWHERENGQLYASVAIYGHSGSSGMQSSAGAANSSALASPAIASSTVQASSAAAKWKSDKPVTGNPNAMAPIGIARLDKTDLKTAAIMQANAALVGMSGGQVQTGDKFAALFKTGNAAPAFLSQPDSQTASPYDAEIANHNSLPVSIYIVPDGEGCLAYLVDISARKELEHQLVQSQKMQAIGQLAGGVAHDFNNLLQAIRLNTDELLGRHPVGDPSYPELQKINQTVSRAAGLVKKLLAFSRKQTLRTEILDVTDTLSDVSVLLKQVLVEKVSLSMVHGRNLPAIRADRGQLETAMMNLCVNARDALMDQGGGAITITTSCVQPDAVRVDGVDSPKAEQYICIAVEDNGTGMDEQTQAKIFEPFFTTKEQGKGTGLGLATVYGIIQQSGGHLTVSSTLGVGTTFKIYFPTTDEVVDMTAAAASKTAPKPSDLAGQGTILFVEDEENVRIIAAKTLRKRGYTVIEAGDGEEAFEILEEGEQSFDLMISDVVMPGMDGPTLLRKGRSLLGDAKIVFISGYAEEEFSEILAEHPDITFLPKPFTLLQLAQRVKIELTPEED